MVWHSHWQVEATQAEVAEEAKETEAVGEAVEVADNLDAAAKIS